MIFKKLLFLSLLGITSINATKRQEPPYKDIGFCLMGSLIGGGAWYKLSKRANTHPARTASLIALIGAGIFTYHGIKNLTS